MVDDVDRPPSSPRLTGPRKKQKLVELEVDEDSSDESIASAAPPPPAPQAEQSPDISPEPESATPPKGSEDVPVFNAPAKFPFATPATAKAPPGFLKRTAPFASVQKGIFPKFNPLKRTAAQMNSLSKAPAPGVARVGGLGQPAMIAQPTTNVLTRKPQAKTAPKSPHVPPHQTQMGTHRRTVDKVVRAKREVFDQVIKELRRKKKKPKKTWEDLDTRMRKNYLFCGLKPLEYLEEIRHLDFFDLQPPAAPPDKSFRPCLMTYVPIFDDALPVKLPLRSYIRKEEIEMRARQSLIRKGVDVTPDIAVLARDAMPGFDGMHSPWTPAIPADGIVRLNGMGGNKKHEKHVRPPSLPDLPSPKF